MQPVLAVPAAPFPGPRARARFTLSPAALNLPRVKDSAAPAQIGSAPSDEALMLSYAGGNAGAFEQLYGRHRERLYRFLVAQLRDPALADELFQDTWQRVIAARGGWRPEAAFATWLYRIARNLLADHWRARRHRPPSPSDADERVARVSDDHTPELTLSEFEQRRSLALALEELPDDQREVLLLRLQQELTLEQIGEITGVGRETVKSRLRYAMDKLRARLAP